MNLSLSKWKEFKIKDIFEVKKTTNINSDLLDLEGYIPYVTRTKKTME